MPTTVPSREYDLFMASHLLGIVAGWKREYARLRARQDGEARIALMEACRYERRRVGLLRGTQQVKL